MAKQYFTTIEYPILTPEQFVQQAIANGLNLCQAFQVSGFNKRTWEKWLYERKGCPRQVYLERLHRVAQDMGWLEVSHG